METYRRGKAEMTEELFALEENVEGSRALYPGSCNLCNGGRCARINGEPCRHPEKMRYSIESLGGDVMKTAKEIFDIEIVWAKAGETPPYMVLVGGLLTK